MPVMNKPENVKEQYANDKNLAARIALHTKHSTNKQGFVPWLFEQYDFSENDHVLELGCGNGAQWEERISALPNGCKLILSDFSDGMVEAVKNKYSQHGNVSFEKIDIQAIPHPDESFHAVIANHMLYHIKNLPKALSEVKRVLKPGGRFYSTTNGNGGMRPFLHNALKHFHPETTAFTQEWIFSLQNGEPLLKQYFSDVKRYDYEDSLSVTKTQDLIDWLHSTVSIASFSEKDIIGLFDYFEEIRNRDGAINIPQESGLFISVK
ncbi:MAG: class I SAM-dependent methyltransferase [Oscillospiraceae bacterium]|jgi:ubiquinone/menaquinone biosynthesis C-methylase UbiE|nr:class I SAM-dependent methyltransferase [Oscillospiraceae bacterium]